MDPTAELPLPLTIAHLLLRLRALNRRLRWVVFDRRAATDRQLDSLASDDASDPQTALLLQLVRAANPQARIVVSDAQADFLLDELDRLCAINGDPTAHCAADDEAREARLRYEAKLAGVALPLDRLEEDLLLSASQVEAILLGAAVEFAPAYETIYSFVLNDVSRRLPCIELFCDLAEDRRDRLDRRLELGRFGRLRRLGLIVPVGEAATELRQEFRLAPGLFDYLLEGRGDPVDLFGDRAEVTLPDDLEPPPQADAERVRTLGRALREGRVEVVGVWGPRRAGPEEVALSVAKAAGLPVRRWSPPDPRPSDSSQDRSLAEAIQAASLLDAALWISTDDLAPTDAPGDHLSEAVAEALASARVRVLLTGKVPWQPAQLLAARPFVSWPLTAPDLAGRAAIWKKAVPAATADQANDLAARFPWGPTEVRAAARLAAASTDPGSGPSPTPEAVQAACAALDRQSVPRFATLIIPKRGPDDLVLPTALKAQVLEVADFHRSWPGVSEGWGFGRMMTGPGGIRALFTGEPGTGKTLAAEVIAGRLGRPLLNLDLSQVVSKWVGETEKHLDSIFREAEERDSVLLLDEADALLGRRGEIRHGSDRYAALEVSYLLQRLESHPGLCLMASNHKENIDPAFLRRFQTILAFPRPGPEERRRIWEIAFPKSANYRLSNRVKLDALARLDMTGAAIVESARTAALISAKAAQTEIGPEALVEAIRRQFQRESRSLSAREVESIGGGA